MVLLRGENGILDGLLEAVGLVFLEGVKFVQPLDEEQVGELLDNGERIGNTAGSEGVPDAVDFGFDFACDHLFNINYPAPWPGRPRIFLNVSRLGLCGDKEAEAMRGCFSGAS